MKAYQKNKHIINAIYQKYMMNYINAEIKIWLTNFWLIFFFKTEYNQMNQINFWTNFLFFFWMASTFLYFRDFIYLIIFFSEKCIFLEIIFLKIIHIFKYNTLQKFNTYFILRIFQIIYKQYIKRTIYNIFCIIQCPEKDHYLLFWEAKMTTIHHLLEMSETFEQEPFQVLPKNHQISPTHFRIVD